MCDRVLVLHKGEQMYDGRFNDLIQAINPKRRLYFQFSSTVDTNSIKEIKSQYQFKINDDILTAIKKFPFKYEFVGENEKYDKVASLIYKNEVIGWFQGRSEFGPRALGNRSILANPLNSKIKYILDLHIKQRDRYRPYAPVVLEEYAKKYFNISGVSPVMMIGGKVLSKDFPAVTHVDGSTRVQTLSHKDNESFYKLVKSFYKLSGFPIVLKISCV